MTPSIIRTVLGDITASDLGFCYAHEHIIIDPSYMTEKFPDFRIHSVDLAVEELLRFHAAGGRAMIDSMPTGGRNAAKLAEVSRHSGVHIVCPTGLHLEKYYPEGHWGGRLDSQSLAKVFVAEIENGIDANDLAGPTNEPLPIRAGLIKIATAGEKIDDRGQRVFEAAAAAHLATGCPILTHTENGRGAVQQVELLHQLGVNLQHVCLSHTDRQPDTGYHRQFLESGVKVEFDSAFRWKGTEQNPTLELLLALYPDYPGQIMLGMDAARSSYWKSHGGSPGLNFLIDDFVPQLLQRDLSHADVERIFVTNPSMTYCFTTKNLSEL
jgi:phosphotriesterase-related protein